MIVIFILTTNMWVPSVGLGALWLLLFLFAICAVNINEGEWVEIPQFSDRDKKYGPPISLQSLLEQNKFSFPGFDFKGLTTTTKPSTTTRRKAVFGPTNRRKTSRPKIGKQTFKLTVTVLLKLVKFFFQQKCMLLFLI